MRFGSILGSILASLWGPWWPSWRARAAFWRPGNGSGVTFSKVFWTLPSNTKMPQERPSEGHIVNLGGLWGATGGSGSAPNEPRNRLKHSFGRPLLRHFGFERRRSKNLGKRNTRAVSRPPKSSHLARQEGHQGPQREAKMEPKMEPNSPKH